jgi:hypothetical protein
MDEALKAARAEAARQAQANGRTRRRTTTLPRDEPPPDPEPAPAVETFTAADLLAQELPEPRWAVEGIVPEGLTILAGKPKLGKSWLALGLALAVADGGKALGYVDVAPGAVLCLALEDTRRRLKGRLEEIIRQQGQQSLDRLTFAREWPRLDKGGWLALREWLTDHKEARLVIVDTWPKLKPLRKRGADPYEEDYAHGADLKRLADEFGVAILALAHCRKLGATDPLEEVSGTLGLTGAADAVLVLRRERGQHDAALYVTGRDVEEQELALSWDPRFKSWSVLGEASEYRVNKERQEVLNLLHKLGKPCKPGDAAMMLGKSRDTTKKLFWRMAEAGLLETLSGGLYNLSPHCHQSPRRPRCHRSPQPSGDSGDSHTPGGVPGDDYSEDVFA